MKRWIAARVPEPVFRALWWFSQVLLTAGVLWTWLQVGLERTGDAVVTAALYSLLMGVPVALEWRHVGEMRRSAPVSVERPG